MYQSDLSDEEWQLIKHHFEPKDRRGSGHKHAKKALVDAIFYVVKGGIPWRMLPKDFPPWKTVYDHFRRWNQSNIWAAVLDELHQIHRKKKTEIPSPLTESLIRKVLKLNIIVSNAGSMVTKK